ncbi:methyl-accepting chemotaxis protein [Alteromonas ponticola]|uniref:Methyl-accepting chemotaxis protein n=1 Tax=Alteromonas aquimaris TaxID=2998417 RepID=A0ABT3P4G9_9ALTE|nr:methyl-accepting chemotaxis protein [Alteromonas aquimaris]MCW8107653.1 methyl-accepting chemotaxis protein [Alteromonas aquimaris]
MKSLSLQNKFMLIVGGSIAIMLFITSVVAVSYIGDKTKDAIEMEVMDLVKLEARGVEKFFATYGGVAKTFLANPFLQNFFADHTRRGAPESSIPRSEDIYQLFSNISKNDANIKSAFFGSANTGEYFYEAGRVGVDQEGPTAGDPAKGYFATQRPWFNTAVEKGELYVTPPAIDSQDGTISAVVQAPVTVGGKLVGVGGVDILISTIGQVIDDIRFKDQGTAFLVDQDNNIVYFPEQPANLPLSSPIADFDKLYDESKGFAQLAAAMASAENGMVELQWQGKPYMAVFKHASLDVPKMDWTLGVLVPASIISDPISDAITSAVVTAVIIIALIALITYWASSKVTRPILKMRDAMAEIANGDGDLTKRLDIHRDDEIGALAHEFNRFTDKLRGLLKDTATHTRAVAEAAAHLSSVSQNTNTEIQQERHQVDNVSSAVSQMAATVDEISKNAAESSRAATEADSQVRDGSQQARDAMNEIHALADSINNGVDVVTTLSKESENIGAVIDVINSIAEQTNLLALNAAIEAARAGEQGRGFAVVADEVRSLASRTQDSTDDIRRMVEKLQTMAEQTATVMQQGKEKSHSGVEKTESVVTALTNISQAISTVQSQSAQIANSTEQQTGVAENINNSLLAITRLSDKTSQHAEELAVEATQLSGVAEELKDLVNQFKI